MKEFDAQSARGKRPLPIWSDAFHRDTQDLSADEVGAYVLLLMSMWSRKTCDLPDDDARLARICRVSPTMWKRRMSAVMRRLLTVKDGVIFSERLQKEAKFVEHGVASQSGRKSGKISDKTLNYKDSPQSGDFPGVNAGSPGENPSQQPNNPTYKEDTSVSSTARKTAEPDLFPDFWNTYPHRNGAKKGKAAAQKSWSKAVKLAKPDEIISAAVRYAGDRAVADGYAKDPATWLNQRCWEDDVESRSKGSEQAPVRKKFEFDVSSFDDYGRRIK